MSLLGALLSERILSLLRSLRIRTALLRTLLRERIALSRVLTAIDALSLLRTLLLVSEERCL